MRRRDLIALIEIAARARGVSWGLMREGARHEVWAIGSRRVTLPRHREIHEPTVRAILTSLEQELGPRWWER